MELNWADAIDSRCTGCGGEAVDWVQVRDGTRRYACRECLEALLRYGTADSLTALPDTPHAVVCQGCGSLTLRADAPAPGIRCHDCTPEDSERLVEQMQAAARGDSEGTPDGEV